MNILGLYPRAWRERYGDELIALLAERPPSLSDQFDLIRGALDARLHPQVPGASGAPEGAVPLFQKQLGLAAAIGGLAWILGIASLLLLPRDYYGERDGSIAAFALVVANILIYVALAELGSRPGSAASTRTGHVVSYFGFFVGATLALGWPLFIIGFYAFPILAPILVVRGSRNGVFPLWLTAGSIVAAVAMAFGGMGGVQTEVNVLLIGVPGVAAFALAWLAFSQRSAIATLDAA